MKCGFCGKELEEGSEFCPECGMILSLGGVVDDGADNEATEVEIPEYTPNVFRAMDFEPEEQVPAMELEVTDEEETAEVVEIIPEYVQSEETEEVEAVEEEIAEEAAEDAGEAEEAEEAAEEQPVEIQGEFLAPEYDPNAEVSEEFLQQVAAEKAAEEPVTNVAEEVIEEATDEAAEETVEEAAEEAEEAVEASAYEIAEEEPEYAPDEYEGELVTASAPEEAPADEQEQSYPVYEEATDESVPEEKLTEDEGLFAALFESAEAEAIEDITPENKPAPKSSKKSYLSVAVLVVVLVGIVAAGGYVFKNVIPKMVDTSNTTTAATAEKVDGTTEKTTAEKTAAEKTTEKTTAEKTTEKEDTTKAEETTTEKETTKATTTKAEETTADNGEAGVVEPSDYDLDELPFFPKDGDIVIKAGPSASSADMITHPWGYPVFAYAKQGDYYYVHSPYLDYMGWVYAGDVDEYTEQEDTTAAEEEQTTAATQEDTTSYLAMIGSAEGLNFRSGPGYDYGTQFTVPGGFYVRVTAVSEEDPAWVYVTVEDDNYPYGSPSGWVLAEYLI